MSTQYFLFLYFIDAITFNKSATKLQVLKQSNIFFPQARITSNSSSRGRRENQIMNVLFCCCSGVVLLLLLLSLLLLLLLLLFRCFSVWHWHERARRPSIEAYYETGVGSKFQLKKKLELIKILLIGQSRLTFIATFIPDF